MVVFYLGVLTAPRTPRTWTLTVLADGATAMQEAHFSDTVIRR